MNLIFLVFLYLLMRVSLFDTVMPDFVFGDEFSQDDGRLKMAPLKVSEPYNVFYRFSVKA